MHQLGVVGPEAGRVVDDLAARLDGRVATVERLDESAPAADGTPADVSSDGGTTFPRQSATTQSAAYGLTADGSWVGTGEDKSLDGLLDELAPDYDYALVVGFPEARIPTVVLDATGTREDEVAGEIVTTASDADTLDVDALVDVIDEFDPHVTLESLVQQAKASPGAERAGAIATFTGRVRAKDSSDDSRTEYLEFERYEGVAARRMDAISRELTERDGVHEVLMHHRTGYIPYGDDIVFVVVLAGHRSEAFGTVEDGINRLKDEVPIFKKERTVDGEFWVHEQS